MSSTEDPAIGLEHPSWESVPVDLSSAERSFLAEVRGALRKRFERDTAEFYERSAAERLGPQECLRTLERAWRQQRNQDDLLAVRHGDTLDVWDAFDGIGCLCDPRRFREGPRPCTSPMKAGSCPPR